MNLHRVPLNFRWLEWVREIARILEFNMEWAVGRQKTRDTKRWPEFQPTPFCTMETAPARTLCGRAKTSPTILIPRFMQQYVKCFIFDICPVLVFSLELPQLHFSCKIIQNSLKNWFLHYYFIISYSTLARRYRQKAHQFSQISTEVPNTNAGTVWPVLIRWTFGKFDKRHSKATTVPGCAFKSFKTKDCCENERALFCRFFTSYLAAF